MNQINKVRAIEVLKIYINTYDQQAGYENYQDKTFINDILYGLGLAVDKNEYYAATGYKAFLLDLKVFIDNELNKSGKGKA